LLFPRIKILPPRTLLATTSLTPFLIHIVYVFRRDTHFLDDLGQLIKKAIDHRFIEGFITLRRVFGSRPLEEDNTMSG
jgi:hypothetical protein